MERSRPLPFVAGRRGGARVAAWISVLRSAVGRVVSPAAVPEHARPLASRLVARSDTAGTGEARRRAPYIATLMFLVVAAVGALAGYLLLPSGELGRSPNWLNSLFRWDALEYLRIAQHGYQWSAIHPQAGTDIAFFPAYAVIDWVVGHLARSWAPPLLTVPSVLFGIAAIFAFDRLALRLLPIRGATVATFAYALYPAACFTLSGYPTSLVNLALIIMFSAIIDRRVLRASGWAGLATSAAPLAAVAAAAVPIQGVATALGGPCRTLWSRTVSLGRAAPAVLAVSGLALSGIIGFVLYQVVRFGSSTAFIAAQHAWGSAGAGTRLVRALTLFPLSYYYGQPALGAATAIDRNSFEMFLQSELGVACLLVCAGLVLVQARSTHWQMTATAGLMILAFYWFSGTAVGSISAPRELYAVIPAFIGVGALAEQRPWIAWTLVGLFAIGLGSCVAAMVAGYLVV